MLSLLLGCITKGIFSIWCEKKGIGLQQNCCKVSDYQFGTALKKNPYIYSLSLSLSQTYRPSSIFFSVASFLKYLIFITIGKMQGGDVLLFYFPMYTSEYHVFACRPSSNFSRTLPFGEHGGLMHWCCSALQ